MSTNVLLACRRQSPQSEAILHGENLTSVCGCCQSEADALFSMAFSAPRKIWSTLEGLASVIDLQYQLSDVPNFYPIGNRVVTYELKI